MEQTEYHSRTAKTVAALLCAVFLPLMLIMTAILCMADAAAEHNRSAVTACFDTAMAIPASADSAFRDHILQMRDCFSLLDSAAGELEVPEDVSPLDTTLVKSLFYWLNYGNEPVRLSEEQAASFVACFVRFEERTREGERTEDPDEDRPEDPEATPPPEEEPEQEPEPVTETYQAAIPLKKLPDIFQNLANHLNRSIDLQTQSGCLEIYYMVRYGDASRGGATDELIDILIDGESEYIGGAAGSPFAEDWRGHVTCEFGNGHRGIDLAFPKGTPIRAVASGTVVLARYGHYSYGNYLVIDHGGGVTTLYAHCSALTVATGQTVSAGQVIARVGSTGNSTGSHLHLEVKQNGTLVNPRTFIS